MKKTNFIFTLILSLFFLNQAFASFPVTKNTNEEASKVEHVNSVENNNLADVELDAPAPPPPSGDMSWGAFALGFLLGLIGVLGVFVFGGDTRSAWKGFGAWVLLLVVLFAI